MNTTIFILGPSDEAIKNNDLKMVKSQSGKLDVVVSNCTPFGTFLANDKTVAKNSEIVILGHHEKMTAPKGAAINLFNLVGDADASKMALAHINTIIKKNKFQRVFNHPDQISLTGRTNASALFADIPGLSIPKTVKVNVSSIDELISAVKNKNLAYPLIVRPSGKHGGEGMYLVNNETEFSHIPLEIVENDSDKLLIEFMSSADENGYFHKCRIVFVNGQIYPRHFIFSKNWCVHSSDRSGVMTQDAKLREQEKDFLEHFESRLTLPQALVLNAMNQRLKLDLWGLDCAFDKNGQVVLFEANACMNFHDQDYGPKNEFRYIEPFQRNIRRAIKKLIMQN